MELRDEILEKQELLTKAVSELKERGKNYAMAYKKYRVLLAQELLKLKAEGMATTIASDIARGKEEIASAKEQELITETLYRSCLEAINVYKLQLKVLENQYDKEWGQAKNE